MLNQILLSDLKMFGLSEYEARTYLVLSMYGSSTASFISEHTRIPSSKIYDVLYSLKVKGLLELCSSKPKKFRSVDPKYALTNMIAKKEAMVNELKIKTKIILSKLTPPKGADSNVWNSTGKEIFYNKSCEMLRSANNYGIATTTDFSRYPFLDEEFLKAAKRGVKIKILGTSELNTEIISRATWYAKNGADIRIIPMKNKPVFGIADNKSVIFKINSDIECDFMWSANENLVSVMKSYFEQLWEQAKPINLMSEIS